MNNVDRTQWVLNDEGLYSQYRFSRLSMSKFITQNKAIIDEAINNVLNNKKPAHYLVYGG